MSDSTPLAGALPELGAANHRSFFTASAARANRRVEHHFGGVFAEAPGRTLTVAFPSIPENRMSDVADEVLAHARSAPEQFAEIGWWSLDDAAELPLGARLLARGFDWGWKPNWMSLDLTGPVPAAGTPEGVRLEHHEEQGMQAVRDGRRLGTVRWHVSSHDDLRIGGLFDMGVEEEARRQGIGSALTAAACQALAEAGCRYVLLNATGMGVGVYRRAGFELLGEVGQTWWLSGDRLHAPATDPATIAVAEAIGLGDLAAAQRHRGAHRDLDAPLAGGHTALEIAATCRQPGAARWLLDHGATLQVIAAWDLGWHEETREALARDPRLADRATAGGMLHPLHIAAHRGDLELLRVLLEARPDLTVTDGYVGATPAGWARHYGQDEAARLIEDAS